jgi:replicative DNA helicase
MSDGIPTGIEPLDDKLHGLQEGVVTVACGRPAMGKSSFALAIADEASARGATVDVFSLEDARRRWALRWLSRRSRVPANTLRAPTWQRGDFDAITRATLEISARKALRYQLATSMTAQQIVRAVRRNPRKPGERRIVVVDYLQRLRWPDGATNEHQAWTRSMVTLSDAAARDGDAYLVLSQLNRDVERRQDKRPQLSDLRESGGIEEHAKCVLGLYRGAYYSSEPRRDVDYPSDSRTPTVEEHERTLQVLILKNNFGPCGRIWLRWDGPTTRVS